MNTTFLVVVAILFSGLAGLQAQRGPGRGQGRGQVERRAMESIRGEFEAWKTSILMASSLKGKFSDETQEAAEEFYQEVRKAVEEERLPDVDFDEIGQDYIRIVMKAESEALDEDEFWKQLNELKEKSESMATGAMVAELATPDVNRDQLTVQELIWYGVVRGKLSSGQKATVERKKTALVSLEEKAKADEVLKDRERDKLKEDAREVLADVVDALAD